MISTPIMVRLWSTMVLQQRSTAGAQNTFNIHGSFMICSSPITESDTACSRMMTCSAVVKKLIGTAWAIYKLKKVDK